MIPSLAVPIKYIDILYALGNSLRNKNAVSEFQDVFSQYIECKYAFATSSGTAALHVLLTAYGLKNNDEIIIPAYTCESLGRLLIDMGYFVKFVDVDTETYNICIEDLQQKISKNTKAVIAVHMFGNPCEMDAILEISHNNGSIVIEDAAQAMGAQYGNKKVGTIGDAGFFSLGVGKPITSIGGGLIVTDDREIADKSSQIIGTFKEISNISKLTILIKMVMLPLIQNRISYSLIYDLIESRRIKRRACLKECKCYDDVKYKYTNIQACLGRMQLSHLEEFNRTRYKNAKYLLKKLAYIPNLKTPKSPIKGKSIYLRLPIWMKNITFDQRNGLVKELERAGIDASIAYPNSLPHFFSNADTDFLNTGELIDKTITLPTHPLVRTNDLIKIIKILKKHADFD